DATKVCAAGAFPGRPATGSAAHRAVLPIEKAEVARISRRQSASTPGAGWGIATVHADCSEPGGTMKRTALIGAIALALSIAAAPANAALISGGIGFGGEIAPGAGDSFTGSDVVVFS